MQIGYLQFGYLYWEKGRVDIIMKIMIMLSILEYSSFEYYFMKLINSDIYFI